MQNINERTYYEILQVDENANELEIKKAYRKLALLNHPDKRDDYNSEEFLAIQKSYEVLINPTSRSEYDRKLLQAPKSHFGFKNYEEFKNSLNRYLFLPSTKRISETIVKLYNELQNNFYEKSKSETWVHNVKSDLLKELNELNDTKRVAASREKLKQPKSVFLITSKEVYENFILERDNYFNDDIEIDSAKILRCWERLEMTRVKTIPKNEMENYLYDLKSINENELVSLIECFESDCVESLDLSSFFSNRKFLYQILGEYMPQLESVKNLEPVKNEENLKKCSLCTNNFTLFRRRNNCVLCGRCICSTCLKEIIVPEFNLVEKLQKVCLICNTNRVQQYYATCWLKKSAQLYRNSQLQYSRVCFLFAFYYSNQRLHQNLTDEIKNVFGTFYHQTKENFVDVCIGFLIMIEKYLVNQTDFIKIKTSAAFYLKKYANENNQQLNLTFYFTLLKLADHLIHNYACDFKKDLAIEINSTLNNIRLHLTREAQQKTDKFIDLIKQYDLNALYVEINEQTYFEIDQNAAIRESLDANKVKFDSDVQSDMYLLLRSLYKIKSSDSKCILIGLNDLATCFMNNLKRNYSYSIDFEPAFELLAKRHLSIYHVVYTNLLDEISEEFLNFNTKIVGDFLQAPTKLHWSQMHIVGYDNQFIRIYEEKCFDYYNKGKWNPMRVALAYIDLTSGVESPSEYIICFLNAALWLLSELDDKRNKFSLEEKQKYALNELIFQLLATAEQIAFDSNHREHTLQYYTCKLSLFAKISLSRFNKLSKDNLDQIVITFRRLTSIQKYIPLFEQSKITTHEAVLFNCIYNKVVNKFLSFMTDLHESERFLDNSELFYKIYEKGLFDQQVDKDELEKLKVISMHHMLRENKSKWTETQHLMKPSYLNIDTDGWFINSAKMKDGSLRKNTFVDFRGFELDYSSGKLKIFASKPWPFQAGYFSWYDIDTVLRMNSDDMPIYFSLDQPTNREHKYHPFQKFTYHPKLLKGTEYLSTLFHTDYLMKQWSIGEEICRNAPFVQRKSEPNVGIFANVPEDFATSVLKSTSERGDSASKAHRFWIEAQTLEYEIVEKENKYLQVYVGNLKLIVKTHEMCRDVYGNLVDTDRDIDPDSPAAKFAKDLTNNFDKICAYYPEFERLRLLCKLQVIPRVLSNKFLEKLAANFFAKTRTMSDQKQAEKFRKCGNNVNEFLRKYRQSNAAIDRFSYEYVPAVTSLNKSSEFTRIIYGGISFNCQLIEKKGLSNDKLIENRHEVNTSLSNKSLPTFCHKTLINMPDDCMEFYYNKTNKENWRSRWKLEQNANEYFYHYTSIENYEKIKASGKLEQFEQNYQYGGHPKGVYFTTYIYDSKKKNEMKKEDFEKFLAKHNFGNADSKNFHKQQVVIRIHKDKLPNVYKKMYVQSKKEVYVVCRDIDLREAIDFEKDVVIRNINDVDFE